MLSLPQLLRSVGLFALAASLSGCVIEGGSPNPTAPPVAPAIVTNPSSVTVPIGLVYTLSVVATGSPLDYQWSLNGTPISGATGRTYTTPTFTLADSGNIYTVTVSNSAGKATSQPATLTAGARAPKAGDLRFQQVDTENTVNGYGTGAGTPDNTPPGGGLLVPNAIGVAFVDTDDCNSLFGCDQFVAAYLQPAAAVPLATSFNAGRYSNLESNLSQGFWASTLFGGGPVTAPNNVITHLQLDPTDNAFDLAYVQTSQAGGFDLAQHTINPANLAAAATQEGLSSRVITAISYNAGQITYFSYGWTGDTTTQYETITATTTFTNAGNVASSLAAQGYILTAIGGDAADGIVMVGTRVLGDTIPRPILIEPSFSASEGLISTGGYALVGVVNDGGTGVWIGER